MINDPDCDIGGERLVPHSGVMVCVCAHDMGRLFWPLQSGIVHRRNMCKWSCCECNWDEVICTEAFQISNDNYFGEIEDPRCHDVNRKTEYPDKVEMRPLTSDHLELGSEIGSDDSGDGLDFGIDSDDEADENPTGLSDSSHRDESYDIISPIRGMIFDYFNPAPLLANFPSIASAIKSDSLRLSGNHIINILT